MNNITIIKRLKELDLSTYPQKSVSDLIDQLDSKIVRMTVSGPRFIERIRLGEGFTMRSQVSYKKGSVKDSYNRATIPGQSVFYGTVSHEDEPEQNRRYIALCECSRLLKTTPSPEGGREVFTLSKWLLRRPIKLGVIVNDTIFQDRENHILKEAKDFYKSHKTFIGDTLEFCDFVTEQFSKPVEHDYQYLISATVADRMMNASCLDGILYPSVQADGQRGMNVALKKDSADNALLLNKVAVMELVLTRGKADVRIIRHAAERHLDSAGILDWEWE